MLKRTAVLIHIVQSTKQEKVAGSATRVTYCLTFEHAKKGDTRQRDMLHTPDSFRLVIEITWSLEKTFLCA
jgi:hypothetical protein